MTIRGGVADVLATMNAGNMLMVYGGGLHHVHTPGDRFPRLFQPINATLEEINIVDYKLSLGTVGGERDFRHRVKEDLQNRRDRHCPK